ncbi:MAG TPA: TrmH family RNA methyltransferase [Acidimicrobiales bacterium]|jgi:tRNA (guanosine-2'-O-)-methyltransferase|nr:TrmH family RNA methyltransferase [Acidimicrobiales bacterium]
MSETHRTLSGTEAKRLHRDWRRRTERVVSLVLDNVQTPFNVGSIVRTAASFRVEHLYIVGAAAITPDHQKSKKTSLGTERLVPWSEHAAIGDALASVRAAGQRVVGIELATGGRPLHEVVAGVEPVCLVVGHEDRGLSAGALASCDAVGFIPTPGKVGSLNVAVAAAIALYEVRRAEWTVPPAP